jgi:hypothetical protein
MFPANPFKTGISRRMPDFHFPDGPEGFCVFLVGHSACCPKNLLNVLLKFKICHVAVAAE